MFLERISWVSPQLVDKNSRLVRFLPRLDVLITASLREPVLQIVCLRGFRWRTMNVKPLDMIAAEYPPILRKRLAGHLPPGLTYIGKLEILENRLMGGSAPLDVRPGWSLRPHDLARAWRDEGVVVVSGFHSRMEKECFRFLDRGTQPMVICPAEVCTGCACHQDCAKP